MERPNFCISRQFCLSLPTWLPHHYLFSAVFPVVVDKCCIPVLNFQHHISSLHFSIAYISKDNIRSTCCGINCMLIFQLFYPFWSPNYFPGCNPTLCRSRHRSMSIHAQPSTERYQPIYLQMACWIMLIAPFVQQFAPPGFSAIVPHIESTVFFSKFVFSFRYWERYGIGPIANWNNRYLWWFPIETSCVS